MPLPDDIFRIDLKALARSVPPPPLPKPVPEKHIKEGRYLFTTIPLFDDNLIDTATHTIDRMADCRYLEDLRLIIVTRATTYFKILGNWLNSPIQAAVIGGMDVAYSGDTTIRVIKKDEWMPFIGIQLELSTSGTTRIQVSVIGR